MNLVKEPPRTRDPYYFDLFDDFLIDQLDALWVDTVTDSGTVAMGDAVGGVAVLTPSDGTVGDNDEAYLASPNEVFKAAAGKPLMGESRLQFTEANTDDANVAFGFQNAVGADSILDNGAGLKVSGSTLAIYKVDGETVWRCVSAINGVATVTQSTTTAGGSAYQTLRIELVEFDGTYGTAVFLVDGQYLRDSDNRVIKHRVPYASATEMQVFVGVKNGGANNQTLQVDYLGAAQTR